MRLSRIISIATISMLLLQSCVNEKLIVEEIKGYSFGANPKGNSTTNAINDIIAMTNRVKANVANANNESNYEGLGLQNKDGKVEIPEIKNTDYLLVFNQQEFDKTILRAMYYENISGAKKQIDFSKNFVFVIIHPSKFISGLQFYDSLDAEVENETTILIKPSFSSLPYDDNSLAQNYNKMFYQVKLFKIPKANYKNINIQWETGEVETLKMVE